MATEPRPEGATGGRGEDAEAKEEQRQRDVLAFPDLVAGSSGRGAVARNEQNLPRDEGSPSARHHDPRRHVGRPLGPAACAPRGGGAGSAAPEDARARAREVAPWPRPRDLDRQWHVNMLLEYLFFVMP